MYSTNTYALITVGFFSSFLFSMAWVCSSLNSSEPGWGELMPSALLAGLRSQWHLWRWKAWTCRGDNLYPYLREMLLKAAGEQQKPHMAFFMQGSGSKNYFLFVNRYLYLHQHHQNKSKWNELEISLIRCPECRSSAVCCQWPSSLTATIVLM